MAGQLHRLRREEKTPRKCPYDSCDGDGFVVDAATNTASDCRCRPERLAQARARSLKTVVPQRYMDLSWERFPLPEIARENPVTVREVKRYCEDIDRGLESGKGLWLLGPKGTGKTTLGYMVAAAAVARRRSVLSYNAVALLNRIRASYGDGARESTDRVIDGLVGVELLHIEDLRVVRPTDWVLEQLYLIVNTRYEEQRAIVFTSDVVGPADERDDTRGGQRSAPRYADPNELEQHVGPRTFSRLVEICGEPLPVMGSDHRLDSDPRAYKQDAR